MRALAGRLRRLEDRLAGASNGEGLRLVVTRAGQGFALDTDRCVEILRECGRVPAGISLVNLGDVPDGLNAAELETHLREHAEEICNSMSRR